MTALAKDLAEGQYLQVNEKVICLQKSENGIQISCESGRQSKAIYPEAFVKLEAGLIYLAGDAFGGGSIAGAVRSAKAVFAAIPRVP